MRTSLVVGIVGAIIVAVVVSVLVSGQGTDKMEVTDAVDKKVVTDTDANPTIQERLEEIEKDRSENQYTPKQREWLTSGPFQIDRSEYVLGEKILMRIGGLSLDERGNIVFLRPLNSTHHSVYLTIPFDGADKHGFNYYFQPQLSKNNGYCTVDDFVGDWRVVFRGTNYSNLEFKITEEILPGDEDSYQPVC